MNINSVTSNSSPVSIKHAARPFTCTIPSESIWPSFFKTRDRFLSSSRNFWSCMKTFMFTKLFNKIESENLTCNTQVYSHCTNLHMRYFRILIDTATGIKFTCESRILVFSCWISWFTSAFLLKHWIWFSSWDWQIKKFGSGKWI